MTARVRTVGIVAKPQAAGRLPLLEDLLELLQRHRVSVALDGEAARLAKRPALPVLSRAELPRKVDLLVVLGGDGTLLSVARHSTPRSAPILGVNLGNLGFLTEVSASEMERSVLACLQGPVPVERRMMLRVRLARNGKVLASFAGLNDAVVAKTTLARMIEVRVDVGGDLLTAMRGDGVIVATPTGSTAYNLSAGGPIVTPGIGALLVTPLCPHTLTMRPLLVDARSSVEITLLEESGSVFLTVDGQQGHPLEKGDRVRIGRARATVPLVIPPGRSHFALLREKLGWGSGPPARNAGP
ncbi:MAG: NAD(+)/NADH kinase [Acidobacteriota bacterium]